MSQEKRRQRRDTPGLHDTDGAGHRPADQTAPLPVELPDAGLDGIRTHALPSENDPIRVLEVLEATIGGTRKHLTLLVRGLDRNQFDVEVACPAVRHGSTSDTSFVGEIEALQVVVRVVDMRRELQLIDDARALWQLFRLIRCHRYDVVHCHSSKAGFLGRLAAGLAGVPTVYTPNGFYFLNARGGRRRFYVWLERLAGLLTDRLVAVSESEMQAAVSASIIPQAKIRVIPNAIDSEALWSDPARRKRARHALGIDEDTPVVGTVARFTCQKDPFAMIHAMQLICSDMPDAVLLWCGEGEQRAETEALARRLGIESSIRFLGFRTDVEEVMSTYDVFLLTSLFEGLPYTILEAMALSIPVVATDVVGNRDIVADGETGLLVPPHQPAMAARAVVSLLRDAETRLSMGENARERVREQFSLRALAGAVATVYYEVGRQQ